MEDIFIAVQILMLTGNSASLPAPDGYCLDVRSECGPSNTGFASITAVTDQAVWVTAVCANGDFLMDVVDGINYVIDAHYTTGGDGCVFFRRARSRTYFIYVHVAMDSDGNDFQQIREHYTVTCAFDGLGWEGTSSHTVPDSPLAPLELQTNVGAVSESEITLQFTDLLGVEYAENSDFTVRKSVQLVAQSDGAGGEAGIQVISCDGVGSNENGMRYPFLRAGCGDGMILPKDGGFVTTGLTAVSCPFQMFDVHEDRVIKMICNVTLCSTSCDGSSCANDRRHRENDSDNRELQAKIIRVLEPPAVVIERKKPDEVILTKAERRILVTTVACIASTVLSLIVAKCLYSWRTAQTG